MPSSPEAWYDAWYFRHCCGRPYERSPEWLEFFDRIADRIVADIGPRTVMDVGCAMGFLVEALRDREVEAFGIDISEYALQHVREDIRPYVWKASILEPLPGRYDLIVCIEVLEHLPPAEVEKAIDHLCQAADDILFSSTPHDFGEPTHLNVQPLEYWAERFARRGFFRDVDFDASFIAPWAVRFRRSTEPLHRIIGRYERTFWRLWMENSWLGWRNRCPFCRPSRIRRSYRVRRFGDGPSLCGGPVRCGALFGPDGDFKEEEGKRGIPDIHPMALVLRKRPALGHPPGRDQRGDHPRGSGAALRDMVSNFTLRRNSDK